MGSARVGRSQIDFRTHAKDLTLIEEFLFGFLSLIVERAVRCALYGNREGSVRPEPRKVLPGPWERETV
jgi:hypothetical protein